MLVSQEVIKSIVAKVSFYNLPDVIEIDDIEQITSRVNRKFENHCLYWLELNEVPLRYINKSGGMILPFFQQPGLVTKFSCFHCKPLFGIESVSVKGGARSRLYTLDGFESFRIFVENGNNYAAYSYHDSGVIRPKL